MTSDASLSGKLPLHCPAATVPVQTPIPESWMAVVPAPVLSVEIGAAPAIAEAGTGAE